VRHSFFFSTVGENLSHACLSPSIDCTLPKIPKGRVLDFPRARILFQVLMQTDKVDVYCKTSTVPKNVRFSKIKKMIF
jgi:hypothetical protein